MVFPEGSQNPAYYKVPISWNSRVLQYAKVMLDFRISSS